MRKGLIFLENIKCTIRYVEVVEQFSLTTKHFVNLTLHEHKSCPHLVIVIIRAHIIDIFQVHELKIRSLDLFTYSLWILNCYLNNISYLCVCRFNYTYPLVYYYQRKIEYFTILLRYIYSLE